MEISGCKTKVCHQISECVTNLISGVVIVKVEQKSEVGAPLFLFIFKLEPDWRYGVRERERELQRYRERDIERERYRDTEIER